MKGSLFLAVAHYGSACNGVDITFLRAIGAVKDGKTRVAYNQEESIGIKEA